jgi:glycosyltransferase involved in cell wall biosynthesis
MAIRLLDASHVTFCVLSTDEVRLFPENWGVDPGRLAFTPWPYTFSEDQLEPPSPDGTVFAGGESMRDYGPLIEAVAGLDAPVRIAADREVLPPGALPRNVRTGRVSHREFVDLMQRASVVAVPLAASTDRSAGQQTYLNAMAMGKPVVVTDALGVRDYIESGRTGLVVPVGDAEAMRDAIAWALDPAHRVKVEEMGRLARTEARERFSPEAYGASVVRVVVEALQPHGNGRG